MEKEKMTLTDALMTASNSAATNEYIYALKQANKQACIASAALQNIDIEDVYNFGCAAELERLKRNAAALHTLLSMCADAAEYIKSEIHTIFEARHRYDMDKENKHREALRKEEKYQRKKKSNDTYRNKQPADETGKNQ